MTTMVNILEDAAQDRSRTTRPALAAATLALVTALALPACDSAGPARAPAPAPAPKASSDVYRWGVVGNQGAIAQLERGTPTAITGITGKVVQIATSNSDGYALTSTGQVFAWGVNSYAELGDGQETPL